MMKESRDLPYRSSIRGSRVFLYGGMALLILLVSLAAALMLVHTHHEAKAAAMAHTQNLAKSIDLSVSGLIETVDVALQGAVKEVGKELKRGRIEAEHVRRILHDSEKYIPSPVSFRLTDEAGDIVYGVGGSQLHVNVADRQYFTSHRDGSSTGLYISGPIFSRVENRWAWIFSRRISKPDGTFAGVLYAVFPLQTIHDIFTRFRMEEGNVIALRTWDMTVIARHPVSSVAYYPIGGNSVPSEYIDAIGSNPYEGSYVDGPVPIDHVRHVHSYSGNPKYGYRVNVGMTLEAAFDEWHKLAMIASGLLIAFLLTLAWLSRSIVLGWKRQEQYVGAMVAHEDELKQLAHFDAVTGLPNRARLSDLLFQAMKQTQGQGGSLAVAYLDIDRFKAVNDKYGHVAGDELLRLLAQRMSTAVRKTDTLARIGGDEFAAVLVGLENPNDCHLALACLLEAVSQPIVLGDSIIETSASIGVTIFPSDSADADQLLRHANLAMYQAKEAGGNRYHLFDVDQAVTNKAHSESLARLRQALEQDELVLYFQPKVNMRTGDLLGVEALIRWRHPEQGLLPPASFMPLIGDHPLGIEVGEWVIRTALHQVSLWRTGGLDIAVSVNISGDQLLQTDFAHRLSELLQACPAFSPRLLELEILETSALDNIERVSQVMRECRLLGVRFSLDDFGTGYSSLSHLKRLPADMLKIDRGFIRGMLESRDDLILIEGVIRLASAFGLEVIAEGIETPEQKLKLLSMGCENGQGYAIGRPMPADALPGWLAAQRPVASAVSITKALAADSINAGTKNALTH